MRTEVHVRGVEPDKEGKAGGVRALNKVDGVGERFVVDGLHAFLTQRTGILDGLTAFAVRFAVEDTPRAEFLPEIREVLGGRIIAQLGLLFGIEMIEVAKELIEAVHGRKDRKSTRLNSSH